jgi:hypothetical protein
MYELFRDARDKYETDTRLEMRYAFLRSVTLRVGDQVRSAFSREISRTGVGLLHNFEAPLDQIEVAIPTEHGADARIHVNIRWQQPVGQGWYISGGEFVEIPDICV